MLYEWDEAKRQSNIQKHGIDFLGIEGVFAGTTVTILDDRYDYANPGSSPWVCSMVVWL
jgi:hypothetical protein